MSMLSKCRICLVESGSHSVATEVLEELYEKLTATPFQAADGRPLKICYICRARLQNCYHLQTSCQQSEKLFTELLGNKDNKTPTPILDKNTIKMVHPVTCTTWPPVTPEMSYEHPNPDPLGVIDINIRVKEEILEDAEDDTTDQDFTLEYTGLEDIVKTEDDVSSYNTHTSEAGHNSPSKSAEPNEELDIKQHFNQSMESQDDLQSDHNTASTEFSDATSNKQVRIVSNKTEVNTPGTRADKKLKVKEIAQSTAQTETSYQQFSYEVPIMDKTLVDKHIICNSSQLNKHVVSGHIGEKRYSCEICKKRFNSNSHLTRHIRVHTGEKPYSCDICKKCFNTKSTLTKHIRIHTGEKPYSCDICKKCFKLKNALTRHSRVHIAGKHICEICKKGFNRKSELNYHIRQHTDAKLYYCEICKKYFKRKDNLSSHIRLHTGVKPYSCEICKKDFHRKNDLNCHIRVHTGVKPYSCEICKKGFYRNCDLIRHVHVHTGEKPYRCDICKKRFNLKSNLSKHIRKYH